MTTWRLLVGVVVSLTVTRTVTAEPDPAARRWRVELQSVHHASASSGYEANARILNGVGIALAWSATRRLALVGSVHFEGSTFGRIAFNALPIGASARYHVVNNASWALFGRVGLAVAREWVQQSAVAGTFARDDFVTTRVDVGMGAEYRRDKLVLGGELRLLSLQRASGIGDAPDYPSGEGPVPRSAAGVEVGLLCGFAF